MKLYVSLTSTEATTAEGQPLTRGEEIELTPEQRDDPFNARLIAEGQLISVSQTTKAREAAEAVVSEPSPTPDNNDTEGGTSP